MSGADGVELDIQATRDGEVIVFHDPDGLRVANDKRVVKECAMGELTEWDVGSWKNALFARERIPLLSQVLREAPAEAITMIEIKAGSELLPLLVKTLAPYTDNRVALLSFDLKIAGLAVKALPHIPVYLNVKAWRVGRLNGFIRRARSAGLAGVSLGWSERITDALVRRVHSAGLSCAVWTVNDAASVLRAKSMGVDILMTDDPAAMLPLVRNGA